VCVCVCGCSSRAKCIRCCYCDAFFSPNKFIFHYHRTADSAVYNHPDAANFNSWRRHLELVAAPPPHATSSSLDVEARLHAWEDVKASRVSGASKDVNDAFSEDVRDALPDVRDASEDSVMPQRTPVMHQRTSMMSHRTSVTPYRMSVTRCLRGRS